MDVRVESHQIAEGLNEQDKSRRPPIPAPD